MDFAESTYCLVEFKAMSKIRAVVGSAVASFEGTIAKNVPCFPQRFDEVSVFFLEREELDISRILFSRC
jgi:hypothetical protein